MPLALPASAQPHDHDDGPRTFVEAGVPATGFNRAAGAPIWRFPNLEHLGGILGDGIVFAGFETLGAFDPGVGVGNGNAQPLTPDDAAATSVATYFDETNLPLLGVSRTSVPDVVLNRNPDDALVLIDDFGATRAPVPCATDTDDPTVVTRAGPCPEAVSLGTWMDGSGTATFPVDWFV